MPEPNQFGSVVCVHGLNGDLKNTWTHKETEKTWISDPDFLKSLATQCRVMSFGYNANVLRDIIPSCINHHANDLLEKLYVKRYGLTVWRFLIFDEWNGLLISRSQDRPIIFVAHSLGGIIVKRVQSFLPLANGKTLSDRH